MFYLIAAIVLNVVISAMFKVFPRYGVNTLQAIVVNYCVCVVTGLVFIGHVPGGQETFHAAWFPWSLLMGVLFISIFYLLGYSMKVDGITTTVIANKLSLVIPVLFSLFMYNELAGIAKIAGILLAFPAIYLTAHVPEAHRKSQNLLLPAAIFVGGGALDTLMKYMQYRFLHSAGLQAIYAVFCFGTAAAIGLVIVVILAALKKTALHWRNIVAGICMGVPNYFSIYYLIRMLNSNFLQSSAAIPVLNIGILVASSLTAIFLFREQANRYRIFGLALSVIAILLIAFGDKTGVH
jgi:drug/metabolite transporter (DMT)-like permease